MPKYDLVMTFKTAGDSKANVTVNDVEPLISNVQVGSLMDTIIAQNIFETKTGDLVSKLTAKVITSETQSYDLV